MSARVKSVLVPLVLVVVVAVTQGFSMQRGLADATGSDGHGTVKVAASTGGSGSGHSRWHFAAGGGGTESCTYEPAPPYVQLTFGNGGLVPGRWLLFGCPEFDFGLSNSEGTIWMHVVWATYAIPRVSKVATIRLAQHAESSIALPSPLVHTDPSGATFVNLATWFWVARDVWHPFTATARAGRVVATATATPVQVEFSTGDGGRIICAGPGTPYDPNKSSLAQSTTCFHTYWSSSANQPSPDGNPNDAAYVLEATITWDVSWTAVGAPGGGTLPPLTTTTTARLRVEQIESVELP